MSKVKKFKCHECGKVHVFTKKHRNRVKRKGKDYQLFCDRKCYLKNVFENSQVTVNCACCGKQKVIYKNHYKRVMSSFGRYVCSRKCADKSKVTKRSLNLCQRQGCNHPATELMAPNTEGERRYCTFHFNEYKESSKIRAKNWAEANPVRVKKARISYEKRMNDNCFSIISNLVPDYMRNYKLREEMGRTIWLSLFEKHGIFCYNELFLGEKGNMNRRSLTADLYIPSIRLLIEAKRNIQTTSVNLTNRQLEGYLGLFEERFGFTPDTWDYSIDGSGANNNFYDTAIELEKRILKAVKKKKLIIRSIRDFKNDMKKIKQECIANRDCFYGGLSI